MNVSQSILLKSTRSLPNFKGLKFRKHHLNEGVEEGVSMDEIERVIEREVANVSDDEAHHASNLLTIIKDKPRNRVKSGILISPWVKDGRIKKKI